MNSVSHTVFYNKDFIPRSEVRISPDDRGFMLGDGVYEVARIYSGSIFFWKDHLARLNRSLAETRIQYTGIDDLSGIINELIRRNNLMDSHALVYVQITRGAYARQHSFPSGTISPTVFVDVFEKPVPSLADCRGAAVILMNDQRRERCDIKAVSLLPAVMANQAAAEQNAQEAVLVRNGFVTEGSHTNIMAVFSGTLHTHPLSHAILPGITRQIVLDLCRTHDIPVVEEPIPADILETADECFITGTVTEIVAVSDILGTRFKNRPLGPVTQLLMKQYRQLTQGRK